MLARLIRQHCSDCGSGRVRWFASVLDLARELPREDRADLADALAYVGTDPDAWRCEDCGHFGVFGGVVVEQF